MTARSAFLVSMPTTVPKPRTHLLCLLLCTSSWMGACSPAQPVAAPGTGSAAAATTPAPGPSDSLPDASGWGSAAGLRYLEIIRGAPRADEPLPLLLVIHGLGDKPDRGWLEAIDVEPNLAVRMVLPQAPTPHGTGFSWFPYRAASADQAALAQGIALAADRLAQLIRALQTQRPTRGKAVVSGFSQGGMLSYALWLRHPALVAYALPISGMLPEPSWPQRAQRGAALPALHALHGTADRVVAFDADQRLVTRLRAQGYDAELSAFEATGHEITAPMSALARRLLSAALRR